MQNESFRTLIESNAPPVVEKTIKEALEQKKIAPDEINFRTLYEGLLGSDWYDKVKAYNGGDRTISEAVSVTAANGITGQIFFTTVMDTWNTAPHVLGSRVRTIPTKLSGEKIPIPGISSRYAYDIGEGQPGEEDQFGRHWIETPRLAKSFKIMRLTHEAVQYDRAGYVLESARDFTRMLAEGKELRIAACLAGATVLLDGKSFNGNTWKWCKPTETSATAYDTYQTSATGAGINSQTGATLVDETDVEELALLATAMTHPDTGQPMGVASDLNALVVTPWRGRIARRIMNATEIRELSNSDDRETISGRGIPQYEVVESVHLYNALISNGDVSAANAKDYYFLANLNKGLAYFQSRPLNVEQQTMGDLMFERDLVWSGRCIEEGQAAVMSPWHLYRSKNS